MDKDEDQIKRDLKSLQRHALAILLYGSKVRNESTERSDVDICVVAPNADHKELYREILRISGKGGYDIKLFEKLPLFMKMEVIKNHKIIYTKNIRDLYEYFYRFRKLWKDQEHRQSLTDKEMKNFIQMIFSYSSGRAQQASILFIL